MAKRIFTSLLSYGKTLFSLLICMDLDNLAYLKEAILQSLLYFIAGMDTIIRKSSRDKRPYLTFLLYYSYEYYVTDLKFNIPVESTFKCKTKQV